jgi:hypothetical protein
MKLIEAAHQVLANWETGDLAGAVRKLNEAVREAESDDVPENVDFTGAVRGKYSDDINSSKEAFHILMGKKFELSELNAAELFKPLVGMAIDGRFDALETWLFLGFLEKAAKMASEHLKSYAIDEAYKYPGRTGVIRSASFMVKQTGDRYDYEGHAMVEAVKNLVKLATEAAKQGREFVDDKTGQVIPPATLKTKSKETIQHSLKKWKGTEF